MDFRTPKDHADKYFGEKKTQSEEKGVCLWQRNTGGARQTTKPYQLLFQLATALFYGTFALHFQNCWKAKLGSAGTIIWTQAASNVPLSTLSSLCCGRKLPGQKPHQNYTHRIKNKPTE